MYYKKVMIGRKGESVRESLRAIGIKPMNINQVREIWNKSTAKTKMIELVFKTVQTSDTARTQS